MISARTLGLALLTTASLATLLCAQADEKTENKPAGGQRSPGRPTSDLKLVQNVIDARAKYQAALQQLRSYYISAGDTEKRQWVEEELRQWHRIPKQAFRPELDVANPKLKAARNIPEANELYRRAMAYKDRGWGNDYIDNQRRAELLLQQLLQDYPESDKIGDAAYQLGDIYESKAYRQYRRAAYYFERSFQWNPNTQLDARLRAARLYDRVVMDRNRARELYQEILTHETDSRRIQEAQKRLEELKTLK